MKAIILAAGKGIRLGTLTDNIPKGMIKLFGKTLIERQIEIYRNCGIDDTTIVTGYKSEMIHFSGINYIKNQNFATTNINESFFCASEKLSDSVFCINWFVHLFVIFPNYQQNVQKYVI